MWSGDTPRRHDNIDICVAVATDNGLITPIVRNAIDLGVQEISDIVKVTFVAEVDGWLVTASDTNCSVI